MAIRVSASLRSPAPALRRLQLQLGCQGTIGLASHPKRFRRTAIACAHRPLIELEPTDHLLAIEQRIGITLERAKDLSRAAWHPGEHEIDESLAEYVQCGSHGHRHPTYVCIHLVNGEAEAMFWPEDQTDTPWPDAWCERCDAILEEDGDWTARGETFAQVTLICSGCYEAIRDKLFPDG